MSPEERKALMDLWNKAPETRPILACYPCDTRPGLWTITGLVFHDLVVAALARDAIAEWITTGREFTSLMVAETGSGEWYAVVQIGIGPRPVKFSASRPTRLLALIAAALAVAGGGK